MQTDPLSDSRIDQLEARLAHQDHAIHELSGEVYRQQQQIAQLDSVVRQLVKRLGQVEQHDPADAQAHEVPPHY